MKRSKLSEFILFAIVCCMGFSFQLFVKNNPYELLEIEPTGEIELKKIDISEFTEIVFEVEADVDLKFGEDYLVWNHDVVLDSLMTFSIQGDKLFVTEKFHRSSPDLTNKITLSITDDIALRLTNQTVMMGKDTMKIPNLKLNITGNSYLSLAVQSTHIIANISDRSKLDISGSAKHTTLDVLHDSSFYGGELSVKNFNINARSRTDTRVKIDSAITGRINRQSKLLINGNPSIILVESGDNCKVTLASKEDEIN